MTTQQKGFTLPELLTVGAVVGLLIVVAILIARPADIASQRRNAQRWLAVGLQMQVLEALVRESGSLPKGITEQPHHIGSEEGMVNLCPVLKTTYDERLLYDPLLGVPPQQGSCHDKDVQYVTGLTVGRTSDNNVTITAPAAEHGEKISLTKQF